MVIDEETLNFRKEALRIAKMYVEPLCEIYPPEQYTGQTGPSTIISSSGSYIVTPGEQFVNLMITIATWLVDDQ